MIRTLYCAVLYLLVTPLTLTAQIKSAESVKAALLERIARVPGAQVGVSVRELGGSRALSIDGDTVFHAASTMKVPYYLLSFANSNRGSCTAIRRSYWPTSSKALLMVRLTR